jgi:hypothetical protein
LNREANRISKKQSSAIIAADVRRFGQAINMDEIFGTQRRVNQWQPATSVDGSGMVDTDNTKSDGKRHRHDTEGM